jgi:hypothetical protein
MTYLRSILFFGLFALLFSCQDDTAQTAAETKRITKQNDSILKVISSSWKFNVPPPTPKVAQRLTGWQEWELFNRELKQKPQGNINAYRQKAKMMVTRAEVLVNGLPPLFSKPQVMSRIGVLNTKVKSLYTFISVETIPDKKVITLIGEVTHEMVQLQIQFDELVRISEIPKEQGEEEMLRALDTVRMANPGMMGQPATQQPLRKPSFKIGGQPNRNP